MSNHKLTEMIRISKKLKKELDKRKIVERETYNDVIKKLLKNGTKTTRQSS